MAVGMMSRVGPRAATAFISVRGDFSPFDQQIKNEAGRSKARFAAVGKAAAAGIAVGVAVGGKAAVKAAVDLGEQINKTKVVFRGHERVLLHWSKTTATAIGTSRREALEAAGTFGNMLVPMGFARGEAAKMSRSMVTLAADMASFNNASPAETLDAIRAGLAGETEPLRRYGVFLNDARLKQEAMKMGLKDAIGPNGALTANAKAQATYSLILKDSADAQGDFKRTSGSLANQQRILKAQVEDVGAAVGKELIPPLTFAAKHTSKFIRQMQNGKGPGGEFAGVVSDLAEGAKDAGEFVGPVLLDIGKFAAKHDSVIKVAGGVTALALGLKGIKSVGRITGITDLLGIGKGALGRGGGGIISKAAPVPVFVTNMGGLPGGKPGAPGVPLPGDKPGPGKPSFVSRLIRGVGWVAVPVAAGIVVQEFVNHDPRAVRAFTGGGVDPGHVTGRGAVPRDTFDTRGAAREHEASVAAQRDRALRIRSMGMEVEALRDRVVAGRRLVERLKDEGASTDVVSRAERRARERTLELKTAQYDLAKQTGASKEKLERLRSEIEKLRSKRISVAVDINIPSLNVRAPGNLTGTGPQGPGMRTGDSGPGGDGWGISGGISRKVAQRVRASAKRDPLAYLIAAGGGDPGSGPGAFHAFDPLAAKFGLHLSSGYRPGSITSSGNLSYHAMNRAGDYSDGAGSMLNFARFMAAVFGSKLKELIHTPLGFSIKNGQRVAPYAQADHYDHVHAALERGGQTRTAVRALVGEKGPEFVDLPAGAIVHPASVSRKLRSGDGWGISPEYRRLIRIASKRYGIPPRVLAGLIKVESGWNPNAVSPAGAFGLTQFMPGTATGYGVRRGSDHGAVASQIIGAAHYLDDLGYASDRLRALGAYNGGPGNPQYGYANDVIAASAGYRGIGAGARRRSRRMRRRGHGRQATIIGSQGALAGRTVDRTPFGGLGRRGALEAWLTDVQNRLALREAQAALTPGTEDDLAVAQDAAKQWRDWLEIAKANNADAPTLTGILQNIKAADDAVTGFGQEEKDRLAEAIEAQTAATEANTQIMQEVRDNQNRTDSLVRTQGPALMGALSHFVLGVGGQSAGRGRQFPSFAGVGGLARA